MRHFVASTAAGVFMLAMLMTCGPKQEDAPPQSRPRRPKTP